MNGHRILLIAHNVLDPGTNMGKTLSGFFRGYASEHLAELYFHSEVPTMALCRRYYRITDIDAFQSVSPWFRGNIGQAFSEKDIDPSRLSPRTDTGILEKMYAIGSRRKPWTYAARNRIRQLSDRHCQGLYRWISEFSPDVIFFAAGDYAFAYDIAYRISRDFEIPIVMYCCDDYFLNPRNPGSLLGRRVHKGLMQSVRRCVSRTSAILTVCDQMACAYQALFDLPIHTVYTGYRCKNQPDGPGNGIVYLGNLGEGRYHSLVEIGRALKRISERTGESLHLDVYSGERRPDILRKLTQKNGIVFHGAVDADAVSRILAQSRLVVHTESFDQTCRRHVMYSVSTKLADLLASGRCIFAYGPSEVASMEYLLQNRAACVVHAEDRLEAELEEIWHNPERRNRIIASAACLSEKNHNPENLRQKLWKIINQSCRPGTPDG